MDFGFALGKRTYGDTIRTITFSRCTCSFSLVRFFYTLASLFHISVCALLTCQPLHLLHVFGGVYGEKNVTTTMKKTTKLNVSLGDSE